MILLDVLETKRTGNSVVCFLKHVIRIFVHTVPRLKKLPEVDIPSSFLSYLK